MKILIALFLVGAAAMEFNKAHSGCAGQHRPSHCPLIGFKDWSQIGDSCFKYFGDSKSFLDAEIFCRCQSKSAHLASVHSACENKQLFKLIHHHNKHEPRTWLGGFRFPQSKMFMWIDGSNWSYENWTPGNPSNYKGEEHCTEMNWSENEKWNDHSCNERKPFVCMVPLR
ncbi:lectin [Amia ocellicauda]|uniref:lectin n=1 Tax=Amia ocellicauda TaxID=2972642 RepID=UPI0034638B80|nr:LECA protein [Amia calva]